MWFSAIRRDNTLFLGCFRGQDVRGDYFHASAFRFSFLKLFNCAVEGDIWHVRCSLVAWVIIEEYANYEAVSISFRFTASLGGGSIVPFRGHTESAVFDYKYHIMDQAAITAGEAVYFPGWHFKAFAVRPLFVSCFHGDSLLSSGRWLTAHGVG